MKKFDDEFGPNFKLAEALGLDANTNTQDNVTTIATTVIPVPVDSDNEIEDDTDYARKNLLAIIDQGQSIINLTIKLLEESHHPRISESLSLLLKTQAENIDKLLKIHKDKKELDRIVNYQEGGQQGQPAGVTNIDKAVIFSGTSDDLVRLIRKEQKTVIDVRAKRVEEE